MFEKFIQMCWYCLYWINCLLPSDQSVSLETVSNLFRWKIISTQTTTEQRHKHSYSFIGRDIFITHVFILYYYDLFENWPDRYENGKIPADLYFSVSSYTDNISNLHSPGPTWLHIVFYYCNINQFTTDCDTAQPHPLYYTHYTDFGFNFIELSRCFKELTTNMYV